MHGEEEGERGHGLFAAGEVLHVAEALEGGHGVVFDAIEVRLVAVFHVEIAKLNFRLARILLRVFRVRCIYGWAYAWPPMGNRSLRVRSR